MLGRKADYIVATIPTSKPADAVGPVLRRTSGYRLCRENPAVPGADTYAQRRFDRNRIYTRIGFNPR